MIQKLPLKTSQIDQLLTPQQHTYQESDHVSDPKRYIEAQYLAKILWHLELDTPRIDRDLAIGLLKGDVLWKTKKGKKISLKENFEFELLEELGIVICEHNWIRVNARLPSQCNIKDFHSSLRAILRFSEKLQGILYNYNTYLEPVSFSISKESFEAIVPRGYTFSHFSVEIEEAKSRLKVKLNDDGWGNGSPISDYFWKIYLSKSDRDEAIDRFFDLRAAYSYNIRFPNFKSFNREESDEFDHFYDRCIQQSKLIHLSLLEYKNYLISSNSFDISLMSTIHTTHIELSNESKNKNETKTSPNSLNDLRKIYSNCEDIDLSSDIELMKWSSQYDSHYHYFDDLAYLALRNLSKRDIYIDDYFGGRCSEKFDAILKLSKTLPVLRLLLIKHIPFGAENSVNLYYLSKSDLLHIGFKNLIREVKSKFSRNGEDYKNTIENTIDLICKTSFNVCKNANDITLISPIIIELVKNNIGEYKSEDEIDIKCLNNFLSYIDDRDSVKLFIDISDKLNLSEIENDNRYKIYLLFRMLSHLESVDYLPNENCTIKNITIKLVKFYTLVIENSLDINDIVIESDIFYDELDWHSLDKKDVVEDFVKKLPSTNKIIANYFKCDSSSKIDYTKSIEHYLQVLNNCIKLQNSDKDKLFRTIKELSLFFGFKNDEVPFPIFGDYLPSFHKQNYDLWNAITKTLDILDYNRFKEFSDEISERAPYSTVLMLSSNTLFLNRKEYISKILVKSELDIVEEVSISDLEKSFLLSLEQKQFKLAHKILIKANSFFDSHDYKENSIYKQRLYNWRVLEYKYKLLQIYYSNTTNEKKWQEITKVDLPENPHKHNHNFSHSENEAKLFYRYILGLVKLTYEPKTSLIIFDELYNSYKTDSFSYLTFVAEVNILEKENSSSEHYRKAIKSYKQKTQNFNFFDLDVEKKAFFLNVLLLSKTYNEIQSHYIKLEDIEKYSKSILLVYSKYLRVVNDLSSAKSLIEKYKEYNSPYDNDDEIEVEYRNILDGNSSITKSLDKDELVSYDESLSGIGINDDLINLRYLRNTFNEIKGRPVKELSQIISPSPSNLDVFLYNEMIACSKEILSRATNLATLREKRNEDIINDWFVSLFNSRFCLFKPYMAEQRRMGQSDTNNIGGIGELDGLIVDTGYGPISIYEAMNLDCIDNTVINKHLNKLSKYDTVGLSPIFIVSFCYFNDFIIKSNTYFENLKKKQYLGFADIDPKTHSITRIEKDTIAHLATAVETRYREGQTIKIFHILIDLS